MLGLWRGVAAGTRSRAHGFVERCFFEPGLAKEKCSDEKRLGGKRVR